MASPPTASDTTVEPVTSVTSAANTSTGLTTLVERLCTVPAEMKVGGAGEEAEEEAEASLRLKKELMKYRRTAQVRKSCRDVSVCFCCV